MMHSLRCIALHTVKYSDRHSIVHLFSRELGRVGVLVPQGNGRGARARNALFMPLSVVDIVVDANPNRELMMFREGRQAFPLSAIYSNPVKNAIGLFLAEMIGRVTQFSQEDRLLYSFFEESVRRLDESNRGIANFHICFLYRLGCLLGIEPDTSSFRPGYAFDMQEGHFAPAYSCRGNYLDPDKAAAIVKLARMTYDNMRFFRFNRQQRRLVLDSILLYYRIHNTMMSALKSPDILSELFD